MENESLDAAYHLKSSIFIEVADLCSTGRKMKRRVMRPASREGYFLLSLYKTGAPLAVGFDGLA